MINQWQSTYPSREPVQTSRATSICRLNSYLDRQLIDGCTVDGLYRLFNQGDLPDFAFNKGGRLYARGDYQRMERKRRPNIRINGERVVEVDVGASHLTMYHAILGHPLHTGFDPYEVPGVRREVVKSFIVLALGNGKLPIRWPKETVDFHLEKYGVHIRGEYPVKAVLKAVLKHLPALQALSDSKITWADLQYKESCGLIAATETLAFQYDVPALPLHDAVIVPASKQEVARRIMKEAFQQYAGVSVRVSVK